MIDSNVLSLRRHEIAAEIERLREAISGYEAELAEIETAERVIARYTGAARGEAGQEDGAQPPNPFVVKPPPMPHMIRYVLGAAHRQGLPGLEPAEMYDRIVANNWTANKDTIRARAWKMEQENQLVKIPGTSKYALPGNKPVPDWVKEKPADANPSGDASAGVSEPSNEHSRDAMQGGGT